MNDIQIFIFNETPIRTMEENGELWWVLKDVCQLFGVVNHRRVAERLDDDEKGVRAADTPSGTQNMVVVNEAGLYEALFSMQPEQARGVSKEVIVERQRQLKDFKRWVTHEVLPQIRQTGSYTMQPKSPAELLAAQAQLLVDMEKRMDTMQRHTNALEAKVDKAITVFSRPSEDHWKEDTDNAIKKLCAEQHRSILQTKGQMYDELERTAGCSINSRLSRLRARKRKAGMRRKDAMALNKLDAIAVDKQLRVIFEGIVRKYQAKAEMEVL